MNFNYYILISYVVPRHHYFSILDLMANNIAPNQRADMVCWQSFIYIFVSISLTTYKSWPTSSSFIQIEGIQVSWWPEAANEKHRGRWLRLITKAIALKYL